MKTISSTLINLFAAGMFLAAISAGFAQPVITTQPQSRINAEDTDATFSVVATGTKPLSYQWRFNDMDLPDKTSTSLVLSNVQLTSAGGYTVVVTNFSGSITSQVAQLSVAEARVYTNVQGARLSYRLVVPINYDPAKKYPLVLFWHNFPRIGTDNSSQLYDSGQFVFLSAPNQSKYPCFFLSPQIASASQECNHYFGIQDQAVEVLNRLQTEFSIDPDRLYVTGISLGGYFAWSMVARHPNFFAAAVPIASWIGCTNITDLRANLGLPVWDFHADNDGIADVRLSDKAVASMRNAGGNAIYTRYQSGGHQIWFQAYSTPGLVDWVMAQKRGVASTTSPLVTITTPTTAATHLTGLSALDLAGTAANFTNVLQVTWTNTLNATGGTAIGANFWSAGAIPLQVGTTNLIVVAAWATNNIPGYGGYVTFNDTLTIVSSPIRATLARQGAGVILNWSGGGPPYRVQRATDLAAGDWTDLLSTAVSPLVLPLERTAEFYRIVGK